VKCVENSSNKTAWEVFIWKAVKECKVLHVPRHKDTHCLISHHVMTNHRGSGVTDPRILNLGTDAANGKKM